MGKGEGDVECQGEMEEKRGDSWSAVMEREIFCARWRLRTAKGHTWYVQVTHLTPDSYLHSRMQIRRRRG